MKIHSVSFEAWLGGHAPDHDDRLCREVYPWAVLERLDYTERMRNRVQETGLEQQVKNIVRPVRVYRVRATLTHPVATVPGSPPLPQCGRGCRAAAIAAPRQAVYCGIALRQYERRRGAGVFRRQIITALSRIRWLFVIARNSTFAYKGRAADVKQVGRELGVRYVLEGSVRKAGQRVRITGQLIDAVTGTHLWADRFDGSLEDVFDLQDQVAVSVAGVIEPALQAAEMRCSAARSTTDLGAYDFYLRALAIFFPLTKERTLEALGLLDQAIAIDRHYGPALAWAAICHMTLVRDGDGERLRRAGEHLATGLKPAVVRIARRRPTAVELPPRCLGGPYRRAVLGVRELSASAGVLTDNFSFGSK
jgi:TolB-like protein